MCGLTGFLATETASAEIGVYARRMVNTLAHRGPDDAGDWVGEAAGVAPAPRRVPTGAGPMAAAPMQLGTPGASVPSLAPTPADPAVPSANTTPSLAAPPVAETQPNRTFDNGTPTETNKPCCFPRDVREDR